MKLMLKVQQIFDDSKQRYGAEKRGKDSLAWWEMPYFAVKTVRSAGSVNLIRCFTGYPRQNQFILYREEKR